MIIDSDLWNWNVASIFQICCMQYCNELYEYDVISQFLISIYHNLAAYSKWEVNYLSLFLFFVFDYFFGIISFHKNLKLILWYGHTLIFLDCSIQDDAF